MWFLHAFQSLHFDEIQPSLEAKPGQSKVCEVGPFEETLPPPCARLISMILRGSALQQVRRAGERGEPREAKGGRAGAAVQGDKTARRESVSSE